MEAAEWAAFRDRMAKSVRIGVEEYGLSVGFHPHAAGFIHFEPKLERLLDEVDEKVPKVCFDTGHHFYAADGVRSMSAVHTAVASTREGGAWMEARPLIFRN